MGIQVIKYNQVTCDGSKHNDPSPLPVGSQYMYFKYSGLAICSSCWAKMTSTEVARLFEITMREETVDKENNSAPNQ